VHRVLGVLGWPARMTLIALIRVYRLVLSPSLGGGCRFHPSCSVYAERAIRETGALRGSVLAVWRVLRCSPFTTGGVDLPPSASGNVFMYDVVASWRSGDRGEAYEPVVRPGATR
jgi:uncharacterized protein